jgi:hypothetical protein
VLASRLTTLMPRPPADDDDPCAPLDPAELLARVTHAVAPPAAGSLAPAAAAAAAALTLLVVDDGWSLVDACPGTAAGRALLAGLMALGAGSGGGTAAARVATLTVLPGAAGVDVALTPGGPPGHHAPVSLQAGLARRAGAVLQLAPLPTGYSRDVHGRLWVAPGPAAVAAAGGQQHTAPVPCCSALYRLGEHGRARLVGPPQACS